MSCGFFDLQLPCFIFNTLFYYGGQGKPNSFKDKWKITCETEELHILKQSRFYQRKRKNCTLENGLLPKIFQQLVSDLIAFLK